ncbi:MAG: TSUP family transporter [archaeon]
MIFETVILLLTGFISMLYATFSGGGALLIVPVLVFAGASPAVAVATNRFAIFTQSIFRLPFVHGRLGLGIKIPAIIVVSQTIGAVLGALALVSLESELLFRVLGITMIGGALLTYYSPKGETKAVKSDISQKSIAIALAAFFLLGIYRGFFGPAAGIFNRLVSVQVLGLDFVQSITLGAYNAFFASLAALLIFLNAGIVDFSMGIPLTIGAVIGAVIGIKFAIEKGNVFIKNAFVAFSIIFGIYFAFFYGVANA